MIIFDLNKGMGEPADQSTENVLGKFIKSVRVKYQLVKRGREYHGCGEEFDVEKGKGEAISSFL